MFDELCAPIGRDASVVGGKGGEITLAPSTALLVGTPAALARLDLAGLFPRCGYVVVDEADAVLGGTSRAAWAGRSMTSSTTNTTH